MHESHRLDALDIIHDHANTFLIAIIRFHELHVMYRGEVYKKRRIAGLKLFPFSTF